jgi:hypothetical protein
MARLLQLRHPANGRYVALAVNDELFLLQGVESVYDLALKATREATPLTALAARMAVERPLAYEPIYSGASDWRILPPLDHPLEPARCHVSGTGLTHRQSAANRDAMHANTATLTDSMKVYRWGEEGGCPKPGEIGVQPEWFYKGNGLILRAHGEEIEVPPFADDGGEEAEIAGLYVIDDNGTPRRLGFATGNEFSDHAMEKKNYLYLAPSKLRACSIGPELQTAALFDEFAGEVRIERGAERVWSSALRSGEVHMVHSLANLEHHHFKYPQHCRPGDVHIHFYGTSAFSFGANVCLRDGDAMIVDFPGLGKALRNTVRIGGEAPRQTVIKTV